MAALSHEDWKPAVAAVVKGSDGRFLFIRRAPGRPAAGYWTPVTGRPEPGETLEQAVEREVREEVGLRVRARREVHRCPTEGADYMLVWFDVEIVGGELAIDATEVAEARWVTAEEATRLEPTFRATREFFEALGARESPPERS